MQEIEKMAGTKFEERTWLNYTVFSLPDSYLTPFNQREWLHQRSGTSFSPKRFVKA